jgi:hypothetical protein
MEFGGGAGEAGPAIATVVHATRAIVVNTRKGKAETVFNGILLLKKRLSKE